MGSYEYQEEGDEEVWTFDINEIYLEDTQFFSGPNRSIWKERFPNRIFVTMIIVHLVALEALF